MAYAKKCHDQKIQRDENSPLNTLASIKLEKVMMTNALKIILRGAFGSPLRDPKSVLRNN